MAWRGTWRQLPQEQDSTDQKRAPFPTNVSSRKLRVVKGVTIPPINQTMVGVSSLVWGFVSCKAIRKGRI